MDRLKIKKLESEAYVAYENFLLTFEEGLLYYSVKYKDFLEELLSVESYYLIAVDREDKIEAILPLMKREGGLGTIINSLPYYGSNGGILSKSDEAYNLLLGYYQNLSSGVAGATYITNPLEERTPLIEYDIIDKRIGQWTFIGYQNAIEDNIMQSFHSKTRNMVRKSIKENIVIHIDNSKIDFLYETHYENIISIGGKAKKRRFFELIEKYFEQGKDYNIYVATLDDKIIGAVLLFYYNETVEYFTPVALSQYRNLQPTSGIIYQAMIDSAKKGYKWWNWGGTWLSQDGVYRFKKRFGAEEREYSYFIKINNQNIYKATKEQLLKEYDDFYVIPFDKLER